MHHHSRHHHHPQHIQVLGYANTWGLFYGGGWMQLGMQVLGLVVVLVWVTMLVLPFFYILHRCKWLRASRAEEEHGLDFAQSIGHGLSLFDMGTWLWMRKQGVVFQERSSSPDGSGDAGNGAGKSAMHVVTEEELHEYTATTSSDEGRRGALVHSSGASLPAMADKFL